ncbi:MAG: HD-GYP domain-containing protein [Chloroflexota bacterium]
MTRKTKQRKTPRKRRLSRAVVQALALVVVGCVLAALTLLVSGTAAILVACAVLWAALYIALRDLKTANRRADATVQAARDKYDAVIGSLTSALELDDDIRGDHVSRMRQLATVLAAELGMKKADISLLQKATLLADCGKVEIAQSILTKPGALTEQEWDEMKRHPEFGYEFLNGMRHLRDCGDIVLSHHERFDGQGYPRGLKGEDIPLGARIFAVVDAYTAMTSDRPHRKKMSHEIALKEILRNSLTQFDPEVVRAFQRCEERGLIVDREGETVVPSQGEREAVLDTVVMQPRTAASAA